ncbi:hypothetical protein [Chitinophaga varians]|uniref:hypothetical protein n=1 Tax=Chitinophaga varians TaxID=2202339 RepID=UPI00165FF9F9|nr:hypothetical protein [Chitinophaga varians]MBC9909914.1 hypothetical protein [Chitinophaga varians]
MKNSPVSYAACLSGAAIMLFCLLALAFREYVYWQYPPQDTTIDAVLFLGDIPWHRLSTALTIIGSLLILYPFLIICMDHYAVAPTIAIMAFLGLFLSCVAEMCLQSYYLFNIQMSMPGMIMTMNSVHDISAGLHREFYQFSQLHRSLDIPLTVVKIVSSILLVFTMRQKSNINWLLKVALEINVLYLMWHLVSVAGDYSAIIDDSRTVSRPVEILVSGLMLVWFVLLGVRKKQVAVC